MSKWWRPWWLLAVVILSTPVVAAPSTPHVVLVTPRGETVMERVFMDELKRRLGPVRFTLIKPDLAQPAAMAALPERIRQEKPDLIYTWGTPTTVAVAGPHDAPRISDVPIVFTVVADPLRAKLVTSLKTPGRNVTGTSHLAPLGVQLDAIRSYRPFKTLGVVYNPKEANTRFMLEDLAAESKQDGFELLVESVGLNAAGEPDPTTLAMQIEKLKSRGADWLYLGPDTFVAFTHRQVTTQAAAKLGLPSFSANESAVRDAHALFGLFSPVENMARFVAFKAAQILKGERRVADTPIETLQRFSVLVNMCVARSLKIYPPMSLLGYADVRLPLDPSSTDEAAARKACTAIP
jgi:putative tryptophan/tyrosine transport system substrate-binding protein